MPTDYLQAPVTHSPLPKFSHIRVFILAFQFHVFRLRVIRLHNTTASRLKPHSWLTFGSSYLSYYFIVCIRILSPCDLRIFIYHTLIRFALEAAEMRFLRSVKGYTRLDKMRSEVIRKELEISGIQDVRSKHKQNWITHLERMDNTRLPKHALDCKPRGRRDRGRPRKRWQRVDAGTGQTT